MSALAAAPWRAPDARRVWVDWALRDDFARAARWTAPLVMRLADRLALDCVERGLTPRLEIASRLDRPACFDGAVAALIRALCDVAPIADDVARAWWLDRLTLRMDAQEMGL